MIEKPTLLNTEDVAQILGLSVRSVKAYAVAGRIPAQKIGKRWKFTEDAIQQFLNGKLRPPTASDALPAFVPGLARELKALRRLLTSRRHEDPDAVQALDEILRDYIAPMELITTSPERSRHHGDDPSKT